MLTCIEDNLEEKGLGWDELEEKAAKDDKRHENFSHRKDNTNSRPRKRTKKGD